jgi:hypothetical protein
MKERFGHYHVAKHYQAVERATNTAFRKLDSDPNSRVGDRMRTTQRFFNWFERQLARLEPAPKHQEFNQSIGRDR